MVGASVANETKSDDFPFYNGRPVLLSVQQWLLVLAAVCLGFTCLVAPIPFLMGEVGTAIRVILFAGLPLVALRWVAGPHWVQIFRPLRGKDWLWIVLFVVVNLIVSSLAAVLVTRLFSVDPNAAVSAMTGLGAGEQLLFYIRSIPQLLGEELLTILPLLALMQLFHLKFGVDRGKAIVFAWIVTSVMFGLVHLPSYNWNWLQCIIVIGSARLVLTLAYIKSKNIWFSTGTHIINDWLIFTVVMLTTP